MWIWVKLWLNVYVHVCVCLCMCAGETLCNYLYAWAQLSALTFHVPQLWTTHSLSLCSIQNRKTQRRAPKYWPAIRVDGGSFINPKRKASGGTLVGEADGHHGVPLNFHDMSVFVLELSSVPPASNRSSVAGVVWCGHLQDSVNTMAGFWPKLDTFQYRHLAVANTPTSQWPYRELFTDPG